MKRKFTLSSGLMALALSLPIQASSYYIVAPLQALSSGSGNNKNEAEEEIGEAVIELRGGELNIALREQDILDLSSFASFVLDGVPVNVDKLTWSITSKGFTGITLDRATLNANRVQRTLRNAPIEIQVKYGKESKRAEFTFTDNAVDIDIAYLNALTGSAAERWEEFLAGEEMWVADDFGREAEAIFGTISPSMPPLEFRRDEWYGGATALGAYNDFNFKPIRLKGSNIVVAYHGPFTAQDCAQVVGEVNSSFWDSISLTSNRSFGIAQGSSRRAPIAYKAAIASQCEDGDYVFWSTSSNFY